MFSKLFAVIFVVAHASMAFGCSINTHYNQHLLQLLHSGAPYYQSSSIVQKMYSYAIGQLGNSFYQCCQTSSVQNALITFHQMNQYVIANPNLQFRGLFAQCHDTPSVMVGGSMPMTLSTIIQQNQAMLPVTSTAYWKTLIFGQQAIAPQQCLNLGSAMMSSLMACHYTQCYTRGGNNAMLIQAANQLSNIVDKYDINGYNVDASTLMGNLMAAHQNNGYSQDLTNAIFYI